MKGRLIGALWIIAALLAAYMIDGGRYFFLLIWFCMAMAYGEIYAVVLDTIRTIKILRRGSTPDVLRYVPINKAEFDDQEFPISRIINVFEVLGSVAKFF